MYFRIIVLNQVGEFVLRTSKIKSTGEMINARNAMTKGFADETFDGMDSYTVQVLKVTGEPQGVILSDEEVQEISAAVDGPADLAAAQAADEVKAGCTESDD